MIFLSLYSEKFERWAVRGENDVARDTIRSHVRFARLYLRSRLGVYALAGLLFAALLGWLGASLLQVPAYGVPENVIKEILTAMSLLVAFVAACSIGLSARSPFGEEEETASRLLPIVRFCHLVGLLTCGFLMLYLAALSWELDHAGWILARNLAGLAGLALFTARALGSSLSWIGPFAYVTLAVTVNVFNDDPPEGEWTRWAWWPLQSVTDFPSIIISLTLLIFGLGSICLYSKHK